MPAVIDGNVSYIGARVPAWHGLGITKDGWFTAEEALSEAMMDWEVNKTPVQAIMTWNDDDENGTEMQEMVGTDEFFATVRFNPHTSQYQILGIVGEQYTPVQNRQAFQFADEVVGNIGGAHYETAGVLRSGKQVFMTIATDAIVLDEGERADNVKRYILLVNSHDGSLAFSTRMTNVRVVCANTLAMALGSGFTGKWSTRHTKDILNRAKMAKQTLGLWAKYNERWAEQATNMIRTPLSTDTFVRIVEGLFEVETNAGTTKEKDNEAIGKVKALYELSPTCENILGTVWGGLNAVTEYADHFVEVRGGKRTSIQEMQFRRQVGDAGSGIKQRAWDRFYSLVGA